MAPGLPARDEIVGRARPGRSLTRFSLRTRNRPSLSVESIRVPLSPQPAQEAALTALADTRSDIKGRRTPKERRLHPVPVRIMHWLNAIAIIIMVMSGWGVYDDDAIFGWLFFPMWARLGSWAASSLLWHFVLSRLRLRHRAIPAQAAADPHRRRVEDDR